jgi:hypothetical protein
MSKKTKSNKSNTENELSVANDNIKKLNTRLNDLWSRYTESQEIMSKIIDSISVNREEISKLRGDSDSTQTNRLN